MMTVQETLDKLEALGDEEVRAINTKAGARGLLFGVKRADLRIVAKAIKTNPEMAFALWETRNIDAQFLAVLIMKPKPLTVEDLDRLVRSASFDQVVDWLYAYVIKEHPDRERLRENRMRDTQWPHAWAGALQPAG